MSEHRIADIPKNGRELLRIGVAEFKGARFADVRVYATNAEGALVPTKAGVAIRPHMIRQAIEALQKAERLLSEDGGVR